MKNFKITKLVIVILAVAFYASTVVAEDKAETTNEVKSEAKSEDSPPPLPFHTIEGVGGGAITPMAYLVNPGSEDEVFGKPSVAISNVIAGKKNLQAVTVTETLWGRVELGYGADRFGLGDLPDDIEDATGVDIDRDEVWLHHFNLRTLLIKEEPSSWIPTVTAGGHLKVNEGIDSVNNKLGGALSGIGYDEDYGADFTLTASKTFVDPLTFNRPLILTTGIRNSSAAQLGFLGFGDDRTTTFEGSVAILPTNNLLFAYEFRQKANPYDEIPGLVGEEDNWHAVDASLILNSQTTLVAGWGAFGNLANGDENGAWWLQLKHEF